jgi:glucose/mannose-6-phosphate isomerase
MNLDDLSLFSKLDPQNMLAEIDSLPDQLQKAWKLGSEQPLPKWDGIRQVLITGMGGSAIGADLLAAYASPTCSVPIFIHRDYGLPAWARGPDTLVIASSHSGNTEETLSAFDQASAKGCRCLAIATGGKLLQAASESSTPLWTFEHKGQPRAAVGYSFGLLLAVLVRLNLLADPTNELESAIITMHQQQDHMRADIPAVNNMAKRIAGQLVGRWVVLVGADILAPVARRWKGQINELAKALAQFEILPEADHNTLAGTLNPEELVDRAIVLFLQAPSYHPRNLLRTELTRKNFMLQGINTDFVKAEGDTPLAHLWTALHFGDYVAYYLAMAYGVDPTPIDVLANFKEELRAGP